MNAQNPNTVKDSKKQNTSKTPTEIVAYKGFDLNLQCRGYQYEVGETYHHDGEVSCCKSGFHSCEYPLDVFRYYAPSSRFARVRAKGAISRNDDDSKVASASIFMDAEIYIPEMVEGAIKYILDRVTRRKGKHSTGGRSSSSATGNRSSSSATGDQSVSSATGYPSASSATGNRSSSSATGDQSVSSATGGRSVSSATGNRSSSSATGYQSASSATGYQSVSSVTGGRSVSSATGGRSSSSATGYQSVSSVTGGRSVSSATGDQSVSSATGYQSAALVTGNYGSAKIESPSAVNQGAVAIAGGYKSKARASTGSAIVCVYRDDSYRLVHVRAAIAGKDVKPDTWYTLDEEGNFVEVHDENA